jgi:hypothetical protein
VRLTAVPARAADGCANPGPSRALRIVKASAVMLLPLASRLLTTTRPRFARLALCVVTMATVLGVVSAFSSESPSLADTCQNAQSRTGLSAALPDCRAYELVSPAGVEPFFETTGKTGNLVGPGERVLGGAWGVEASNTGERLGYFSLFTPAGVSSDGPYYLATRNTAGWTTTDTVPPQSATNTGKTCFNAYPAAYSADLTLSVFADGWGQEGHPEEVEETENECGHDEPALAPDEPSSIQNLFLTSGPLGPYRLLDSAPAGVTPNDAWFVGAASNLSRVLFTEDAAVPLTPDAPVVKDVKRNFAAAENLYDWFAGALRLVTILPDGTPALGTLANSDSPYNPSAEGGGPGSEVFTRAVSTEGTRVTFASSGNLYVRANPEREQSPLSSQGRCVDLAQACTFEIDTSQTSAPGGGGRFMWASSDGSRIFFTDENQLTSDATATSGRPDLYEYDFDAPEGTRLTDLTVNVGEAANVQGVSGVSEDGGYVYFVADGVLSAGAESAAGESPRASQPNLYLAHAGHIRFIATLDPEDSLDWKEPNYLTSRVSLDGRFLGFNSVRSLTGYNNSDASSELPDQEIFSYDATDDMLSCASCDPSGARPTAPARIARPIYKQFTAFTPGSLQRNVSSDGGVFFNTVDSLLPSDTNGLSDVYEYIGSRLSLISTGAGDAPAYFYEASPDGNNVFFFTSQQLVAADQDGGISIYDARVGGGFPEARHAEPCFAEACHNSSASVPPLSLAGSELFSGPGNVVAPVAGPPRALTRAQKLMNALQACRKVSTKRKRIRCRREAFRRYGPNRRFPMKGALRPRNAR